MRVKSAIEAVLRHSPPLYRLGSRLYHKMNPEFRTLSPGAPGAIQKAFEFSLTDPDARAFQGDYHEFGLFRGGTFLATGQILDDLGLKDVRLYGYDSFEGLPEATGIDAGDPVSSRASSPAHARRWKPTWPSAAWTCRASSSSRGSTRTR